MTETTTQRILLAEDDDAMRVYLERALVNAGYTVDSVDRGTAAIPLLEECEYDLLLAKVLSKPFHLRDLVLEVERVLEDRISARLQ